MEDTLRVNNAEAMLDSVKVLILVLMEDTLRGREVTLFSSRSTS